MSDSSLFPVGRRAFLKGMGAAASLAATKVSAAAQPRRISIVVDPDSALTKSEPVTWAADKLRQALTAKGVVMESGKGAQDLVIVVAPAGSQLARSFTNARHLDAPESISLTPGNHSGAAAILVSAVDVRGFVYARL